MGVSKRRPVNSRILFLRSFPQQICYIPTKTNQRRRSLGAGIRSKPNKIDRLHPTRPFHYQVEALGTGVWAAPRNANTGSGELPADSTSTTGGGGDQPSANQPSKSPTNRATVPLITVETVCVVDVRENKPPRGGAAMGTAALAAAVEDPAAPLPPGAVAQLHSGMGAAGKAPVFATSVLPGELSASVRSLGDAGTRAKSVKAAKRIAREAAVIRKAEIRARGREERR